MSKPFVTFNKVGSCAEGLVTEASDINLIGWPLLLETDIADGSPFYRKSKKVDREGEIVYVRYVQVLTLPWRGVTENHLIVYND